MRNVGCKPFWVTKFLQAKWIWADSKYHTKPYKNWQIVALCSGRVQSRRCRGDHISGSKGSSIFSRECRVVEFWFPYTRIGLHLPLMLFCSNESATKYRFLCVLQGLWISYISILSVARMQQIHTHTMDFIAFTIMYNVHILYL